jgi:cell division protein FtsB
VQALQPKAAPPEASQLHAPTILRLHDEANILWHRDHPTEASPSNLIALIRAQHLANFDLWHEEDAARSPDASDARIAQVKHAIDRLNQQRNDLVEQIDQLLLQLAGPQNPESALHSETPGLIIDRLSILALKIYHTAEEVHRPSASDQHHERNQARLAILTAQRTDLAQCLDELWSQVLAGKRRFRLYRQLKMYNDPDLNPVLYKGRV